MNTAKTAKTSHIELPIDEGDLVWMLTKCRNTLNMAGYYDDVQQINALLDAYYLTKELRRKESRQTEADISDVPF